MKDFQLFSPTELEEALDLLARHHGQIRVLAGGTDLLIRIRDGQVQPEAVLDLTRIPALHFSRKDGTAIEIGPLITHSDVICSPLLNQETPLLVQACRTIGGWQIRNRGTIGGNVCNASPAGDAIPPLSVLAADCTLASKRGRRILPIQAFFHGPGLTALAPDELLVQIRFPSPQPTPLQFFEKIGQRKALAISKVSIAFLGWTDRQDCFKEVRIALGAVAPTVVRAVRTEDYLVGKRPTADVIQTASAMIETEVQPIGDIRSTEQYRREVAGELLRLVLTKCQKEEHE
jgi:CO/xanthine dehydrogenase FAD-binding subunit